MTSATVPTDPALCQDSPFLDPIPGVIPYGSICTLAGASGVGKTTLTASWVKRWLDGKSICGLPTNRPTSIGFVTGDRRWRSHRNLFDRAGCPPLPYYSLRDDASFDWNSLRTWVKTRDCFNRVLDRLALEPGSLLILDPLALFIPGRVNDYKDVAIGLGVLDQVLLPRQLTTLGLFHQSKQVNDKSAQYKRPQDRILGSAAQLGFSDTAMYLFAPEDLGTPYYGFGWVPHNAPPSTFEFMRDASGLFVPYVSDGAPAVEAPAAPRELTALERHAILYDLIPPDGIGTTDLYLVAIEQLHVSLSTVKRDVSILVAQQLVIRDERGHLKRAKAN